MQQEKKYPCSEYQDMFNFMHHEHGTILTQSEMADLILMVHKFHPQHPGSAIWVKASDRLPEIVDKKCTTRFAKVEIERHDGTTYIAKAVAYYFPDHFKTVEWEDWDDYNEEYFPYTESDGERGVVWLRAGWYENIECDTCDNSHWSAPVKVIEWYDESPSKEGNKEREEEEDWIDVNDRLPYKDGDSSVYCLVNDTYDGVVVRPFNEAHECWDQEDGDDYYTDAKGGKITHWKPLPEPPKRKQK
jgi:hypothetical protein